MYCPSYIRRHCLKSLPFNIPEGVILRSLEKYFPTDPVQPSHFPDEEIEGLGNLLKVTKPVQGGKSGLEAKSSHGAFCIYYVIWFAETSLLQILLDIYAHK